MEAAKKRQDSFLVLQSESQVIQGARGSHDYLMMAIRWFHHADRSTNYRRVVTHKQGLGTS
jgi:hypothetical protein